MIFSFFFFFFALLKQTPLPTQAFLMSGRACEWTAWSIHSIHMEPYVCWDSGSAHKQVIMRRCFNPFRDFHSTLVKINMALFKADFFFNSNGCYSDSWDSHETLGATSWASRAKKRGTNCRQSAHTDMPTSQPDSWILPSSGQLQSQHPPLCCNYFIFHLYGLSPQSHLDYH